ncbi:kinase-like domain-containing protein [Phyllosticta citrichinensis]|uniref:Kinase-like domain-containing protein n=1 Tax=Phyllosticta citrichinensis TaxID=1130410 RepID=A0ABR1XFF3_9PEZI
MDLNKLRRAHFSRIADEWASNLRRADIQNLASSFKDGQPCTLGNRLRGSFNLGFPVYFEDGTKWFIRFPIPGYLSCLKEKFLSEIATMKVVQAQTSIRIPALIAWATEGDHPTGYAFMLTEFIEGKPLGIWKIPDLPLDKKEFVYRQLAQLLLSISDVRFEKIGSWTLEGEDHALALKNRPISHQINGLILDGVDVDAILPVDQTFDSRAEYVTCLTRMIRARLEQQPNSIYDKEDGEQKACALYLFELLLEESGFSDLDSGPFVLLHGDLRTPNIMVDPETFEFTGIVDWEWARVVPIELTLPPFWLTGLSVHELAESDAGSYFEECDQLIKIIEEVEASKHYPQDHLRISKVMRDTVASPIKFWVAMCLQHSYDFDTIYWDKIDLLCRPSGQTEEEVVENFLGGPRRQAVDGLVERKMADLNDYQRDFERSEHSETQI